MDALRARMKRVAANPPSGGKTAVVPDEAPAGAPGQKRRKTTAEVSPRPHEIKSPPTSRLPKDFSGVLVDDFLQARQHFAAGHAKTCPTRRRKLGICSDSARCSPSTVTLGRNCIRTMTLASPL